MLFISTQFGVIALRIMNKQLSLITLIADPRSYAPEAEMSHAGY